MSSPGLARSVVGPDRFIIGPAWSRAVDEKRIVGLCNAPMRKGEPCGGYLKPLPVDEVHGKRWYECRCMSCGHEYAAPQGKVLPGSSRRDSMPEGAWDQRMEQIDRALGKKVAA